MPDWKQRRLLWTALLIVALGALAGAPVAQAHDPHVCPEDFPDSPALPGHVEQSDIDEGKLSFEEIFDAGQILFDAVFNICDGQGRPGSTGTGVGRNPDEGHPEFIRTSAPDSNSCAGCHIQPRSGGGGDFVANVFVLAQDLDPVTESVSGDFSNERNTLGMFGAGPIEMLGREMTEDLQEIRNAAVAESQRTGKLVTVPLITKGVDFGLYTAHPSGDVIGNTIDVNGVDEDLVIKPFHQSGVVRSIREFTVNAFNHHHGLQAEERFEFDPLKGDDWDRDGMIRELTVGDMTAATIFQAALAVPGRLLPADPDEREEVDRGEVLFDDIGCTSCHIPELHLESRFFEEPNPFNDAGTFFVSATPYTFDMTEDGEGPFLEKAADGGAVVRAYTDLQRHNLCDPPEQPDAIRFYCNEKLWQGRPNQDGNQGFEYFITRKLWDVGNSAPYGHRGDLTTITEAILAHGGEARSTRDAFVALDTVDQEAIVSFLKTLQVLPPGSDRVVIADASNGSGLNVTALWASLLGAFVLISAVTVGVWALRRRRAA